MAIYGFECIDWANRIYWNQENGHKSVRRKHAKNKKHTTSAG